MPPRRSRSADDPGSSRDPSAIRPTDAELIRGIADGSEPSFRILFQRWAPRMGRFLHQATDAIALVQVIAAGGQVEKSDRTDSQN